MIETNIFLIRGGVNISMKTNKVLVRAQNLSHELIQKVCNKLQHSSLVPALPYRIDKDWTIIIPASRAVTKGKFEGEDWVVEIENGGNGPLLQFCNNQDHFLLASLIERGLLIEIKKKTELWNFDSPRMWYEPKPFMNSGDINAFRRYEISVFPLENVGMGVCINVGTAFFSSLSVAGYIGNGNGELRKRFEHLSNRQNGQKGTLIYDTGLGKYKCYFEEYLEGVTCESTGLMRIRGKTYDNLFVYCKQRHPSMSINPSDPVAKVSFVGIKNAQPVPANRLHLRLMNDVLPRKLSQVDKISPDDRGKLIISVMKGLKWCISEQDHLHVVDKLWIPQNEAIIHFNPPSLEFGNGQFFTGPNKLSVDEYRLYFRNRMKLLNQYGCYYVPPQIERKIYFALPTQTAKEVAERLVVDITRQIARWTNKPIENEIIRYDSIQQLVSVLHSRSSSGMSIVVFDDHDPTTYFNLSYDLKQWRIKRITSQELSKQCSRLNCINSNGHDGVPKELRDWQSFTILNALDVLQKLDCIPWRVENTSNYEAQLVIDVGQDRRYFALSILICRYKNARPDFMLETITKQKIDVKSETINRLALRDGILEIFRRISRHSYQPLKSMLILRDGRESGQEFEGVEEAHTLLEQENIFVKNATVHVVDFHKQTLKGARLWSNLDGARCNAIEGTAILFDQNTLLLNNTGIATLHQGTVDPLLLVARSNHVDMRMVGLFVNATSQLNWSNPRVAQRLPLPLKRTDDELNDRYAQEVRRYK